MTTVEHYTLSLTTQGPTYPPSEVMDKDGNFIVIGRINRRQPDNRVSSEWGRAIVSPDSQLPKFGGNLPYTIIRELPEKFTPDDAEAILYTLPLPLPCNNYPMIFAPEQCPDANTNVRPGYAFHEIPIPDCRPEDGKKITSPITLGQWSKAKGQLKVELTHDRRWAVFTLECLGLIPHSLYTVMSLRFNDLNPECPTRPGPLGIPNVFIPDSVGNAVYTAKLPNPFPLASDIFSNRIINIVVLWMSYQMSYGGAIGWYGLGGDVHAQLKLKTPSFFNFDTIGI
jgi:hypothetical protein